jgi:hypothetical protein
MEFRIWVETRLDDRILERELVSRVERPACGIGPEEIGLTLEEGKAVLRKVQARIVQTQVDVLGAAHRGCCHCGRNQRVKDLRTRTFRTVFGTVQVSCRRYLRCNCQGGTRATVWPLHRQQLSGTSPELQYLYASWGGKVSYRRAAAVLDELLPISDRGVSHATLRRHTLAIGGRLDMRVTEPDEYDWPEPRREPVEPAQSLNVAIDGTYVRADRVMGLAEYHVVAGRIEREGRLGGYFAWVAAHPMCDAEAFMKAALDDHGLTQTSRVRVLADGADSLSNLVSAATEKTTHRVLDWFHISMRLRPIEQMSPGIALIVGDADPILTELLREKIHRVRFQMWNGKWQAALDRLGAIYRITKKFLGLLSGTDAERIGRFRKHMLDLRDYLCRNQVAFRNYAQDRRKGLRISSALAESAMNHLVNERMGKRQPMRWSAEGAHLLLQVRCAVLDNRLEILFREWLPKFRPPAHSPP